MLWIKDNGQEIETNDLKATVEHCESLGWKKAGDIKIPDEPKKKSGRPKKKED